MNLMHWLKTLEEKRVQLILVVLLVTILLAGAVFYFNTSINVPKISVTPTPIPSVTATATISPTNSAPASTQPIPTILRLSIPSTADVGKNITISSILTDYDQHPISGVKVYYTEPEPLGIKLLGSAWTDSNGSSSITLIFSHSGRHQIEVTYSGRQRIIKLLYAGSSDTKTIQF
jgi:hypothetical protein